MRTQMYTRAFGHTHVRTSIYTTIYDAYNYTTHAHAHVRHARPHTNAPAAPLYDAEGPGGLKALGLAQAC